VKFSRLRGTQDIVPPTSDIWRSVENTFERAFVRFGYSGIRTPIFERTELFQRAVGETTDIITKEMYTFDDRGGRSMTLRPENTASVVRAYLENGMHRLGGIVRLHYCGPMFRYERPQAGRYRQFHQVGAEAIGSMNPALDVEIMDVVMSSLGELGFGGLSIKVNSVGCSGCRAEYREILLDALLRFKDTLCPDCNDRLDKNPLRVFDCKKCEEIKPSLPAISSYLCEECESHFAAVKRGIEVVGWPYELDDQLVRGLDYYTKTTFEIIHGDLGAQNALCGGGRYDNLVEEFGGPPTPAVGFSAGLERIISVLPAGSPALEEKQSAPDFFIVCADDESSSRALAVAKELRTLGTAVIDFSNRALKKQLKSAEKCCAGAAVLVDSASPGALIWKDMERREQYEVADTDLLPFAKERRKTGKAE
jgi:histidyl-tRNA synthetase